MRVFVSSLITGFEPLREAASSAIATLGHDPVRAEDFHALPGSPQQACLAGVRDADAVVLILGERYGFVQQSGLSATHEEYREARESRPVLVFIEKDVQPEPLQLAFISEVQGWEHGHFTAQYANAEGLRSTVTRALHEFTLANQAAPLNEAELVQRARELVAGLPNTNGAAVFVGISPGPTRAVLRPAELEAESLKSFLLAEALTGPDAVLTPSSGTEVAVRRDTIELSQRQAHRFVRLDEAGRLLVAQPAVDTDGWRTGIPSIIEEDVRAVIERSFRFAARVLDWIDPPGRLTHVAPIVAVVGAGYLPWRTRSEQERSPNAATMGTGSQGESVVTLMPPVRRRPALVHEAVSLAEDFVVRVRRGG